jgi:hypothetical protein
MRVGAKAQRQANDYVTDRRARRIHEAFSMAASFPALLALRLVFRGRLEQPGV